MRSLWRTLCSLKKFEFASGDLISYHFGDTEHQVEFDALTNNEDRIDYIDLIKGIEQVKGAWHNIAGRIRGLLNAFSKELISLLGPPIRRSGPCHSPLVDVKVVQICNFEFASLRWTEGLDEIKDLTVIHVDSRDSIIRKGVLGFSIILHRPCFPPKQQPQTCGDPRLVS